MVSNHNGKEKEESEGSSRKERSPLEISGSQRTLIGDGVPQRKFENGGTDVNKRLWLLKLGSASTKFKKMAKERDEMSQSVGSSSSQGFRERLSGVLHKKINWVSLMKMAEEWIRNPMNMALFIWIIGVAVSGAIMFLVMTGMLNSVLPKESERNAWFEVNNQIINALFTLMCLYQHPKRFYHLVLLCKWRPEDISRLRKIYCKNGTYKPHEWAHMMVVVILLHINCFAQYALCGLNLGYKRSERPVMGVGICLLFAIGAPAAAAIYSVVSPLGKDYSSEMDEEAQVQIAENTKPEQRRLRSLEKRFSFAPRGELGNVEITPEWSGGILDFWDDISLAFLSLFCSFCVFGWNMERLGFGNMYVHIATFLLFCTAPFWIFNLAAVNINNEAAREAMGVTGFILCGFGLLYGGFWRIQMRKRFNLPPYTFCCGNPAVNDCALWLCCCWCSLAQEVRTGNSYDIVEDRFCIKLTDNGYQPPVLPLATANSPSPNRFAEDDSIPDRQHPVVDKESSTKDKDETMTPPVPSSIEREASSTK